MTSPSVKMLKDRCKKWDQKKYLTPEEMAAVFRRLSIRDSHNKRSEVRVRGKHIPVDYVKRYHKRNPSSLRLELSQLRSSTPPGVRVEVYTPPPSSISTPDYLRLPEEIMQHLRNHILGLIEAKIWVSVGDTQDLKAPHGYSVSSSCLANISFALEFVSIDHSQEVEHMLAEARIDFKKALLQDGQADWTTIDLFSHIHRYARYGKLELILPIVEYFFATASSIIGPKHPIALIYARTQLYLQMAKANMVSEGYETIMASLLNCLSQAVGPLHLSTIDCHLDYVTQVILPHDCERGLSALRDLAHSCNKQYCGLKDLRSIRADLNLLMALNVRPHESHQEKLDLAAKIFGRAKQHRFPSGAAAYYQTHAHDQMSYIWKDQKQFETAEFHLREAIRISSMSYGSGNTRTLQLQAKFEKWLLRRGRKGEANEVRRQRQAAIGFVCDDG